MNTVVGYMHIKDYTLRYKMIRKYRDSLLGDTTLFKDKNHKKTVIVKEKTIYSQEEFNDELKTCEMLLKLNNIPTFTKLDGYTYKPQSSNYGTSCIFFEIREYLENDLEKEVASRLKNKVFCPYSLSKHFLGLFYRR